MGFGGSTAEPRDRGQDRTKRAGIEKGHDRLSQIICLNRAGTRSVCLAIEVCSGKSVDQGILVSPPFVAFPSVFLDNVRYPSTNLGVHSWVAHRLFALVTRKLNRRQQAESFRVIQCLQESWR